MKVNSKIIKYVVMEPVFMKMEINNMKVNSKIIKPMVMEPVFMSMEIKNMRVSSKTIKIMVKVLSIIEMVLPQKVILVKVNS